MSYDFDIKEADEIIRRANLTRELIPSYIIECLAANISCDMSEIVKYVDLRVGGATTWRDPILLDLFRKPTIETLVTERTVTKMIDFINVRLAAIDNSNPDKTVLVARIHKLTLLVRDGGGSEEYIDRYVLVHNA